MAALGSSASSWRPTLDLYKEIAANPRQVRQERKDGKIVDLVKALLPLIFSCFPMENQSRFADKYPHVYKESCYKEPSWKQLTFLRGVCPALYIATTDYVIRHICTKELSKGELEKVTDFFKKPEDWLTSKKTLERLPTEVCQKMPYLSYMDQDLAPVKQCPALKKLDLSKAPWRLFSLDQFLDLYKFFAERGQLPELVILEPEIDWIQDLNILRKLVAPASSPNDFSGISIDYLKSVTKLRVIEDGRNIEMMLQSIPLQTREQIVSIKIDKHQNISSQELAPYFAALPNLREVDCLDTPTFTLEQWHFLNDNRRVKVLYAPIVPGIPYHLKRQDLILHCVRSYDPINKENNLVLFKKLFTYAQILSPQLGLTLLAQYCQNLTALEIGAEDDWPYLHSILTLPAEIRAQITCLRIRTIRAIYLLQNKGFPNLKNLEIYIRGKIASEEAVLRILVPNCPNFCELKISAIL